MTQAQNIQLLELATEWHRPHNTASNGRSNPDQVVETAEAFQAYIEDDPVGLLAALTAAVANQRPTDPNSTRQDISVVTDAADAFYVFVGEPDEPES